MALLPAKTLIVYMWLGVGGIWLLAAFFTKRSARAQSWKSNVLQRALGLLAFFVGFTRYFQLTPLTRRFLPSSSAVACVGIALTLVGLSFAVWARFFLGGNWSGIVTVKAHHTLVRSGPYALVRHPIYSGLLLALIGTAVVYNQVRCLLAAALVLAMLLLKIRIEERFMSEQFGSAYRDYKQKVTALIPFVW
jgi:protein-S-isoprenylcysteine O-methyltransferase Ste14